MEDALVASSDFDEGFKAYNLLNQSPARENIRFSSQNKFKSSSTFKSQGVGSLGLGEIKPSNLAVEKMFESQLDLDEIDQILKENNISPLRSSAGRDNAISSF